MRSDSTRAGMRPTLIESDTISMNPASKDHPVDVSAFPASFLFGAATSAFQVEGGWDAEGKGPSIWDTFGRTPGRIKNGERGDVACDSYHRLSDDLDLISDIGLDSYRFSLSWPRLLPDGIGQTNSAGFDYYDRLIDGLLERGVEPNVTLYHWDLPQALQDRGGWVDRDVANWFAEYAESAFARFGDRVRTWSTLNEPISIWMGYGRGLFAPGISDEGAGRQAMHNALLAHGRAVQAFRAAGSPGDIGIVLDIWRRVPLTDSLDDARLAAEGEDDGFRFFLGPLLHGRYSDRIVERLTREEALPEIHDGDLAIIAEPLDFLGINVYSRVVVDSTKTDPEAWAQSNPHPGGNFLDNGLEFYPRSVYEALEMLEDDYGWRGPVMITENGMADGPSAQSDPLNDQERITYMRGFLQWIGRAITDGRDIRAYYAWSLMDNFEWSAGFSMKFGISHVDPETLARVPKDSAQWYRALIARHRALR